LREGGEVPHNPAQTKPSTGATNTPLQATHKPPSPPEHPPQHPTRSLPPRPPAPPTPPRRAHRTRPRRRDTPAKVPLARPLPPPPPAARPSPRIPEPTTPNPIPRTATLAGPPTHNRQTQNRGWQTMAVGKQKTTHPNRLIKSIDGVSRLGKIVSFSLQVRTFQRYWEKHPRGEAFQPGVIDGKPEEKLLARGSQLSKSLGGSTERYRQITKVLG